MSPIRPASAGGASVWRSSARVRWVFTSEVSRAAAAGYHVPATAARRVAMPKRLLRKPSQCDEQIEAGLADAILGLSHGCVGVARPSLRVNQLDIGRGPGAERDVGNAQHI